MPDETNDDADREDERAPGDDVSSQGEKKQAKKGQKKQTKKQPNQTAKKQSKGSGKKATAKKTSTKKASAKKATKKAAKKTAAKKAGTKKQTAATQGVEIAEGAERAGAGEGLPDPAEVPRPWLAAYPPTVPGTYAYPAVPMTRLLDDAAADFPENEAVHFFGASTSYRQLTDRVDRFASALSALGVGKGDRVALVLPNCPQHVVAFFATLRLGAIAVQGNPTSSRQRLAEQLDDAGCRALVCLDSVYERLGGLKKEVASLEHVIATGVQDALPFPKNRLFPLRGRRSGTYYKIPAHEGVLRMPELIEQAVPAPPPVELDPVSDVAALVYTRGGVGRGVRLTHTNLVTNAFQARLWIPDIQAGAENLLTVMPLFHAYGLTTCLGLGALSAATLTLLPQFDADATLKAVDRRKPTLLSGVPSLYAALSEAKGAHKHDFSSLRVCLSGAAPLPAEVGAAFERLTGATLREVYGLTEASPLTHANPVYGRAKAGSVGLPVTDTVCHLRDLDDPAQPAAEGGPGELAVAGPQVMAGYWSASDDTAGGLADGWLLTGDVATIDEEGYVFVLDLKEELIRVGEHTVYPGEVETALLEHPAVRQAAVVGVAGPQDEERIKAYVVVGEGGQVTDDDLVSFLGERVAPHKLPQHVEFRSELPEDVTGRVLRRELAAEVRSAASARGG